MTKEELKKKSEKELENMKKEITEEYYYEKDKTIYTAYLGSDIISTA